MLLRHPWLAPLMLPPSEGNGETAPQSSESGAPEEPTSPSAMTEDKEVADWVHQQLELLKEGRLDNSEKPALHAVALDKVATSPSQEDPLNLTRRTS